MGHPGRRKVRLDDALKHSGAHSQRHLVTDRRSHRDDDAQQGEEGPARTRSSVRDLAPAEAEPRPTTAPMSEIDQPTESMRNNGTTAATTKHTATASVREMLARGNKRMNAHRSRAPRRSRCHQRRAPVLVIWPLQRCPPARTTKSPPCFVSVLQLIYARPSGIDQSLVGTVTEP